MKKLIAVIMLGIMIAAIPTASAAGKKDVTVKINGVKVAFPDQSAYVDENGRTLVPVRFVSESLRAEVKWDEKNREVTVKKSPNTMILWIENENYNLNGNSNKMDTVPVITTKGRTMVPLRIISESLGAKVEWDSASKTVLIITADAPVTGQVGQEVSNIKKAIEATGNGLIKAVGDNSGSSLIWGTTADSISNIYSTDYGFWFGDDSDLKSVSGSIQAKAIANNKEGTLKAFDEVLKVYFGSDWEKAKIQLNQSIDGKALNAYYNNRWFKTFKATNTGNYGFTIGAPGVKKEEL